MSKIVKASAKEPKASDSNVAAKTPALPDKSKILATTKAGLERHRDVIIKLEENFASASLGSRLQIGLFCLKAHAVFTITDAAAKGQGRKKRNQVTRDVISPLGFEGWLAAECPWLKKPTAYKYMTAVRGLGIDHTGTEKQVAFALKKLLKAGPVSLKSLCDSAVETFKLGGGSDTEEQGEQQQEFDFLTNKLATYREQSESLLTIKDQLAKMPALHKVACARAYATLSALTGTNWQPSDEADELGKIDPDAISI